MRHYGFSPNRDGGLSGATFALPPDPLTVEETGAGMRKFPDLQLFFCLGPGAIKESAISSTTAALPVERTLAFGTYIISGSISPTSHNRSIAG
jgi:hypothetical protein